MNLSKERFIVLKKVLETITKYKLIESGDKIVLGVSGGPDSICMLEILNKLKEKLEFEIFVALINHGIRENATIDEQYVENYCKNLNFHDKCDMLFLLHCHVHPATMPIPDKNFLQHDKRIWIYSRPSLSQHINNHPLINCSTRT